MAWSAVKYHIPELTCVCVFICLIRLVVIATALRQVGHPVTTGSSHLNRYVTGLFHGPKVWVKPPFIMSLFCEQTVEKVWRCLEELGLDPKSELFLKPRVPLCSLSPD